MTSRSGARRHGRQKRLATVRDSLSAISFDRRWMIAAPVALLLAGAVGVNSFAHISKTAGACPIRHPAFCSSRALQAPVTRDLGHDGKLDDRAQAARLARRSEEHTSELQSLMRTSYAVFCLKKKTKHQQHTIDNHR